MDVIGAKRSPTSALPVLLFNGSLLIKVSRFKYLKHYVMDDLKDEDEYRARVASTTGEIKQVIR